MKGDSSPRQGTQSYSNSCQAIAHDVWQKEVIPMTWRVLNRVRKQHGQGMVEYALILVLVSIVVIVILLTMGNQIANVFSNVVAALG